MYAYTHLQVSHKLYWATCPIGHLATYGRGQVPYLYMRVYIYVYIHICMYIYIYIPVKFHMDVSYKLYMYIFAYTTGGGDRTGKNCDCQNSNNLSLESPRKVQTIFFGSKRESPSLKRQPRNTRSIWRSKYCKSDLLSERYMDTVRRRCMGCRNLQVYFRKNADNYRAFCGKRLKKIRHRMPPCHPVSPTSCIW